MLEVRSALTKNWGKALILSAISLWFATMPLTAAFAQTTPVTSPSDTTSVNSSQSLDEDTWSDDGDANNASDPAGFMPEGESKTLIQDTADNLEFYSDEGNLTLSPQDINDIREYKVDVRTVDYLTQLVTPVELGGYGFKHIKVQRILKNYDTTGHGKYDRETVTATEEDNSLISAHNSGQAVDISEVGAITCKAVERRHVGGSTTHFQAAKPLLVAWQSRDGINKHPTPKGPSIAEISGTLGSESILQMLNASGEMDYAADFVKGLKVEDILLYVGANILLKQFGATQITGDPRADTIIRSLGGAVLQKALPGLPEGVTIAENGEDVQVAIARANIENLLGLPPGSIRGAGWNEILKNSGKRTLENALGLPSLYLDSHDLKQAVNTDSALAVLNHFSKDDNAMAVINGTMEKIKKGDEEGLVWAGVGILSDAFRLTNDQRAILEKAAKAHTDPVLTVESFAIDKNIPVTSLAKLLSSKKTDQNEALSELRTYGINYAKQLASKQIPSEYRQIGNQVLQDVINGKKIDLGYVKDLLGIGVVAQETGANPNDVKTLTGGGSNGKASSLIASYLNKELNLSGANQVNTSDISSIFKGDGKAILEKVGGMEADKSIGWNAGTGIQVIQGKKKLDQALEEVFGNTVASILGLNPGTYIPLSGDIYASYGTAIVEQRLGLKPGTLDKKKSASDFTPAELNSIFGDDYDSWEATDLRLGVTRGTTEAFVKGNIQSKDLVSKTAKENITTIGIDQFWNYFDLDERFRIKKDDGEFLINTIRNWDTVSLEDREKAQNVALSIIGRTMDKRANLSVNTILSIASGDTKVMVDTLMKEGVKMLAGAIGVNIDKFSEGDLNTLADQITRAFNGQLSLEVKIVNGQVVLSPELNSVLTTIAKGTGIPLDKNEDLMTFVNGGYRKSLEYWSSAMWTEFANKYLPDGAKVSYDDFRNAVNFSDSAAINSAALALYNEQTGLNLNSTQFSDLPDNQKSVYVDDARKRLTQDSRDNAQYKISDAFLIQAGIPIPKDFSKIMFSGTDAQRTEMISYAAITYLEPELFKSIPGYKAGMLERLYKHQLTKEDNESVISGLIDKLNINLGPFTAEFIKNFYQFLKASDRQDFYTNTQYQGMWNFLDGWLSNKIGLTELPAGFAKSLYYAAQNGFDFNKGLTVNGKTVVPSIKELGQDLIMGRLTRWVDKAMGLPAGSAFQIYQAVNSVLVASRVLTAAHAAAQGVNVTVQALTGVTGAGDALVKNAQANLAHAQAALEVAAITIALNACAACQAFFASVDQAIQAPPGFTNAAVAGAIAMAFGLGPAGLIIAAAIYLFGTYRVDYLCPVPPQDRYALTQFDPDFDKLSYDYGSYYSDPNRPIKDTPAPGENPFDWDEGVPFKNGNDPALWMAWSRFFTGKLLDATMSYGEAQTSKNQPRQIITLRQANVEYFAPRSTTAFGEIEKGNPRVGMGFSQTTTKTTDWVHVSFGGFF